MVVQNTMGLDNGDGTNAGRLLMVPKKAPDNVKHQWQEIASLLQEPESSSSADANSIPGASSRSGDQNPLRAMAHEATQDHSSESECGPINTPLDSEDQIMSVQSEWDFILPTLQAPVVLAPQDEAFIISDLIGAMQNGASLDSIEQYFKHFDQDLIGVYINESVQGFPAMFYAVATNDEDIVRAWIRRGGDIMATHEASHTPLLAFAIMHGATIHDDTSLVVVTLLSAGADPKIIPASLYALHDDPALQTIPREGQTSDAIAANQQWCTGAAKTKLAAGINITHQYYLDKASKTKKPSDRHRWLVQRRNAEALFGLPYFLVGQTVAVGLLWKKLLSHLVIHGKRSRPLVLCFAGPSGHGKTELARRLGHILSLELEVIDCTGFADADELLGARRPYGSAKNGSILNNFLRRNSGRSSIVFLDEFDKTTPEVHQALLLPFDDGVYRDRRDDKLVNCSQTIWIMATNAFDYTIKKFCELNLDVDLDSNSELIKDLMKTLKGESIYRLGAPITGRISAFLPFLIFSPIEQSVIAHKYILEIVRDMHRPVNLSKNEDEENLLGNIRVTINGDASICRTIAQRSYNPDLGARSIWPAIKSEIEDKLVEMYLDIEGEPTEGTEEIECIVSIQDREIEVQMLSNSARKGKQVLI